MDLTTRLPDSKSADLHLDHPTSEECRTIWTNTATEWSDSLPLPLYLEECQFMMNVPLAKDGGMTVWILVDRRLAPNERPILSSCESFRKRSLASDTHGNIEETVVHGIASVFCARPYRYRGYATRMMIEMAKVLRSWQAEHGRCAGSVLYSDIGLAYYARLGWPPNATNAHLVFSPTSSEWPGMARPILEDELAALCRRDEIMVRSAMAKPAPTVPVRVTILPDLDHMLWHIRKEDFATKYLYDAKPSAKGAIAGSIGKQVWAIWTHRYYKQPNDASSENVLYILRLVIEGDNTANRPYTGIDELPSHGENVEQMALLKAVIEAAQVEAAKWQLDEVQLWEPSPLVHKLLSHSGLRFNEVERSEESIASALWYDNDPSTGEAPVWINNEHYAWL